MPPKAGPTTSSTKKTSTSLYDLLRVPKDANASAIRKAYLLIAREVHPDKNPGDAGAAAAFQALKKAYDVLSNPTTRERYDRTGRVPGDDTYDFESAYEKYRGVVVTAEDVDAELARYRASSEEREDVLRYCRDHRGDVTHLLGTIIGSRDEDRERYVEMLETEMKASPQFAKSCRKLFDATKARILSNDELEALEEDLGEDDEEEEEEESEGEDDGSDSFLASDDEEEEENDSEDEVSSDDGTEPMEFLPEDRVAARWNKGPKWYEARVVAVDAKKRTYTLFYPEDEVTEENVPTHLVRPAKKVAPKKAPATKKPVDAEIDDMDALSRAILQRQGGRQAQMDEFEAKWRARQQEEESAKRATKRAKRG